MTESVYLSLPGPRAFSDFRQEALAKSIGASQVRAIYVHHLNLYHDPSEGKDTTLRSLLEYGDPPSERDSLEEELIAAVAGSSKIQTSSHILHVTPRTGTVSPWSSKATSEAQVCGLEKVVKRIERGMCIAVTFEEPVNSASIPFADKLHDRMTEIIQHQTPDLSAMFAERAPAPATSIPIFEDASTPKEALQRANKTLGLALDESEIDYLVEAYKNLGREPTDAEVFMFAQVNSEHCRHKQFNAEWTIDGVKKAQTLFSMIRNTHSKHPQYVISAYSDNAAVLEGQNASFWAPDYKSGTWTQTKEVVHYIAKVETHNHPTAISPYPGAATGSGGEIRDEGAVGRGSKPKAGLGGFSVSDLLIPGERQPWELDVGKPNHITSSLDIMLQAPIGSAGFNNEFGRPCLLGYFTTLLIKVPINDEGVELRGYHKPIMIAGGVGSVRPTQALKDAGCDPGAHVVVLGGPAMLIGLGGGAASSVQSGEGSVDLDFASVQRGNAEVQRRAQEVINACVALGQQNPIQLIHDVGAGGLSNALPELVNDARLGGTFELREVHSADKSMSPMQVWCCEAQERYVLAIAADRLNIFQAIARRERSEYSVVGRATGKRDGQNQLVLTDRDSPDEGYPKPIDLPMSTLFGKPPKLSKTVQSRMQTLPTFDSSLTTYIPEVPHSGLLIEAVDRVLHLPSVGSKAFLITIGDRTVGGLTARDQMVGPWQVPVADVAVTATSLMSGMKTGEAMAMGEKAKLALISPAASARMAVAEALMNLAAADVLGRLERVRLSANWMAAGNHPGETAGLYEAVEAIGMELCPRLGISIPVGKDSMSMKMRWKDASSNDVEVTAPISLVITAFAPVAQIGNTWTPTLRRYEDVGETVLLLVDLGEAHRAMGGSALAQVFGQVGNEAPDVRDINMLKDFYDATQQLQESGIVLAYHDRSDGGLLTTLVEMMFAGRCGLDIMLDNLIRTSNLQDVIETLFNEELGAVFQVRKRDETNFHRCFATCGPPPGLIKKIGRVAPKKQELSIYHGVELVYRNTRAALQQRWSFTSHQMVRLRDNPKCADVEYDLIAADDDKGLSYNLTFDPAANILPLSRFWSKPQVAILREQGVNGQAEMAFAFHNAGFIAVDVHMTDLLSGRVSLSNFVGLAACGGFSYGDVLGAGQGWSKSVLLHPKTRQDFKNFFERKDTFTLGVCNGCQFLSRLADLIPGANSWPTFERNESEQYEARVCMVKISDPPSQPPSVFLHGMHNSSFPIAVAHGEGRAVFPTSITAPTPTTTTTSSSTNPHTNITALSYVSNTDPHTPTQQYPFNPNGSAYGIAGIRSQDGKVLALMPHCERTVLKDVCSWAPKEMRDRWGDVGPWGRVFVSARRWVG
ncbi:MAG: hypothetical protein M1812_001495 [Candelaria pacifica]|nr:MAG: hypothetical protein M1812_001495 [Candelaria pacifica]